MNIRALLTYYVGRSGSAALAGIMCMLMTLLVPHTVGAQFVNFSMEIEPEFSATTEKNLDFGTIAVQSGEKRINLGDPGMGVVAFRGLRYQRLFVSVDEPDRLVHAEEEDQYIPIDLMFAYNNRGSNTPEQSMVLDEAGTSLTLLGEGFDLSQTRGLSEYLQSEWANMYIYIYGAVDVGNVPTGVYENQVTVSIEY